MPRTQHSSAPGAPVILVADDDSRILLSLRVALEARGYVVRTAPNGPSAVAAAEAIRPDLMLVDLAMPGMDGVEVVERIRTWSRLPIVVLSAHTDEQHKVRALDAGADDYVDKPFSNEELLARVRTAIRREQARPDESPLVRAGDLVIDLTQRRVTRSGAEVRLTPTEYGLLRELALNANRVLTHAHLLRAVFGAGYEQADANLRVFIGQLRRKIELDSTQPQVLITEPGVGYRLRTVD
jgi:two-component system, OmpR family, KDP operon response regulator KdpE